MIRELIALLRGRIADHDLLLQLSEPLAPVLGDATQLNQVLLNLLINALEAFGHERGTILVRTEQLVLTAEQELDLRFGEERLAGAYICVTVRDSGCGMSPETQASIFDPFFTTKAAGHGMGLAAVLGIVRGHAGAIRVESAPGSGTTFQVYLPIADAPAVTTRPAPAPAAADSRVLTPHPAQRTFLLIDDEPAVRAMLARTLERLGFLVYTAADGAASLALLAEDLPQLAGVFLDLNMPGMSGPDLVRAIRQTRADIPIVVMSGYDAEEIAVRHSDLRPRCFLQKPFTREALDAALAVMLAPGNADTDFRAIPG